MHFQVHLSCADITHFISASVALGRHFNVDILGRNFHTFFCQNFSQNDSLLFDPHNIDEKNQTLKVILATAVVDLVLYFNLYLATSYVAARRI